MFSVGSENKSDEESGAEAQLQEKDVAYMSAQQIDNLLQVRHRLPCLICNIVPAKDLLNKDRDWLLFMDFLFQLCIKKQTPKVRQVL